MPFFSVIIPVYNGEHTLEECLSFIPKQTFKDFELIIIEDGSTDDSLEVIQNWTGEHLELDVKLIEQENQGLGAARNRAIQEATGQYIALLDCDDVWAENKLEKLHLHITKNKEAKFIYHPVYAFGLGIANKRFCYQVENSMDLLMKGNPIVPSAVCLSSDIAKKYPFGTDSSIHGAEDLMLWYQLMENGIHPQCLDDTLTFYRETGGMSTRLEEHLSKVFNVYASILEEGKIDQAQFDRAVSRKYYEAGRFYHKRKNFAKAEEFYLNSSFNSPKVLGLRFFNFLGLSL